MAFDRKKCIIKTVYCGNGKINKSKHSKKGNSYECLRQGVGAGVYSERKKGLSENSLQQIKYVGPVFEANFRKKGIRTKSGLLTKMDSLTATQKKKLLKSVFTRSNGCVDYRGYNSVLLFLNDSRVKNLPVCETVKPCGE